MTERNYTCTPNPVQRPKRIPHNKRTQAQFIQLATDMHGDRFDYSRARYVSNTTKVKIICPIHVDFEQTPKHHLKGEGCFQCGRDTTGRKKTKTTAEFIADARAVHGDRYDYSNVKYKGASLKVEITCFEHGPFLQKATHHLGGTGCPSCANEITGWSRGNFRRACDGGEGFLYAIYCYNGGESFFKVGITSKGVYERFKDARKMPYNYTELYLVSGDSDSIYNLEKRLHAKLKGLRYKPNLYFNGHTECFESIEPIKKQLEKLTA